VLLDFGNGLFLDRRNNHVDSLGSSSLEHQKGKLAVTGDETVFI
jgi:hypothetical protein